MNERIRELIAQATKVTEPDDPDYRYEFFDKEKFAELIAAAERESIAQMFDGKVWAYDYREIAAAIRARGREFS